MSSSGSTLLVACMITSLFLSTVLISWFGIQIYGSDLGVAIIETPRQMPSSTVANKIDFTSATWNITPSLSFVHTWEHIDGLGIESPDNGFFGLTASAFYVVDIQPDSASHIKNTYVINNSKGLDYKVVLEGYPNLDNSNYIYVKSDGLHIPRYNAGDALFIPEITSGQNIITTDYKIDSRDFSFTFNGKTHQTNNLNLLSASDGIFGGVLVNGQGLIVEKLESKNQMGGNNESLNTFANLFNSLLNLLIVAGHTVTLTLPEYVMPFQLQLLLIFPQEIGLAVGLFGMARGV